MSFALPDPTEAKIRKELIDPSLQGAGPRPVETHAQQRWAEYLFETLLDLAFRGEV